MQPRPRVVQRLAITVVLAATLALTVTPIASAQPPGSDPTPVSSATSATGEATRAPSWGANPELRFSLVADGVRLTWPAASGTVDHYEVFRGTTRLGTTTSRNYTTTLRAGQTHRMRVRAVNARGTSPWIQRDIAPTHYRDVARNSTFHTDIHWLGAAGLTNGCNAPVSDRFCPNDTVSRAQMAAFISRAAGLTETSRAGNFADVPRNGTFTEYINKLGTAGITQGCGKDRFCPDRPVTRGEMAAFLSRALDLRATSPAGRFSDVRGTFATDINRLATAGITQGCRQPPNSRYCPDEPVTRGQMAAFLHRAFGSPSSSPAPAPAPKPPPSASPPDPSTPGTVGHGTDLTVEHVGVRPSPSQLVSSGAVTSTSRGQVISGLDISVSGRGQSGIVVRHDDVVVRDNRIRHAEGADGILVESGVTGALIEHNTSDAVRMAPDAVGHLPDGNGGSANNNVGSRAVIVHGQASVRRNHILLTRSGIRLVGSGSSVIENRIERLFTAADSPGGAPTHGTSISLPGGARDIVVARNRTVAGASGGIVLYAEQGSQRGVDVVDNLVVGVGEGMGIYGGRSHLHTGNYANNRNVRIDRNRFTGTFAWPSVRGGGTNTAVDLDRPGNTFAGNRWVGSTSDLPARCGIRQDACEAP